MLINLVCRGHTYSSWCPDNILTPACVAWQCSISYAINSLTAKGGHDRPLFDKLLWWLVTSAIFVRYQRLIARKLAVLFGFNCGSGPFYAACCFDALSRESFSCLLNASFKTGVSLHNTTTLFFEPKSMTMASAGAIRGKYSHDGGVQEWHLG